MTTRRRKSSRSPFHSLPYHQRTNRSNTLSSAASNSVQHQHQSIQQQIKVKEQEVSTWANDKSESDLSPAYRRQLQQERVKKTTITSPSQSEEVQTSLIYQASTQIQQITGSTPKHLTFSPPAPSKPSTMKEQANELKGEEASVESLQSIDTVTEQDVQQQIITKKTPENDPLDDDPSVESLQSIASNTEVEIQDRDSKVAQDEFDTVEKKHEDQTELQAIKIDKNDTTQQQYSDDGDVDGWGIIDDYENEDNASDSTPIRGTQQDEVNTIASGETSIVNRKNMDKIVPPKYVRYQLMIPPEDADDEQEVNENSYKENVERIKGILTTLSTQIRVFDEKAEIISWKNTKGGSFLDKNEFPQEISNIAKFFKGFKKRMRSNRRTYIKFGLHTTGDFAELEKELQEWAGLYSYSLTRCLIQSNDAGFVGSICYTSQFTDLAMWKKEMMTKTKYEWGFKMVPITSADKHLPWNKRLKAVGAFVPIEYVAEAKYALSELLLPDDDLPAHQTNQMYLERYVFLPPEESLGEDPEPLIAYKSFVHRHRAHHENLKAKLCPYIKVHLDQQLGSRIDPTLTLRRMILAILVKDTKNPLFGTPLFHSVDFVPDTDKLWLPPQEKPEEGGPSVVFTFYKPVEKEARQMVEGLGRYIACMYGSEVARRCFDRSHWKATKGWKYINSTGTFDRPDSKNLLTTMAFDNNLSTIRRLQQINMFPDTNQDTPQVTAAAT